LARVGTRCVFRIGKSVRRSTWAMTVGIAVASMVSGMGCRRNDGPERVALSGSVTFQGRPVQEGQIRFVPLGATTAPVTIGAIRDGAYAMRGGQGVPVGTHRVEITAFNPNDPVPMGPGSAPRKQLLPSKYNRQSELTITIQSGANALVRDFAMTP
jgi:hypothetical protein